MTKVKEELYDRLTGIYNRYSFYEETEKLLRNNPEEQFVIVYWNIQKFKVINELFGREAGDSILIHMAEMLRTTFCMMDNKYTYGRLERDNFILCFPGWFLEQKRFLKSGDITYTKGGMEYHFTSCYGIYFVKDRSLSISAMVDRGRIAMETVEENYVEPFAYYNEEMRDQMVMEQIMMSDCKNAIEEEQFEVYLQPICNTVDGTIVFAEALVRWKHPERGLIEPGKFIPVFEKNGFISLLDRYIWNKVCQVMLRRIQEKKKAVPVSVNVSRVDFYNKSLCNDIFNIVKEHKLDWKMIKLEITESAYSDNPGRVIEIVKRLQEYGFDILMDDFGSGYSSFNTLKDLPVDILKIDMKFMDDLSKGSKSAIILESIVRMAKQMKLKVVAEGVETKKELDFLKRIKCDYIQGFYFYKPMPEKEFMDLLDQQELQEDIL